MPDRCEWPMKSSCEIHVWVDSRTPSSMNKELWSPRGANGFRTTLTLHSRSRVGCRRRRYRPFAHKYTTRSSRSSARPAPLVVLVPAILERKTHLETCVLGTQRAGTARGGGATLRAGTATEAAMRRFGYRTFVGQERRLANPAAAGLEAGRPWVVGEPGESCAREGGPLRVPPCPAAALNDAVGVLVERTTAMHCGLDARADRRSSVSGPPVLNAVQRETLSWLIEISCRVTFTELVQSAAVKHPLHRSKLKILWLTGLGWDGARKSGVWTRTQLCCVAKILS